MNPRLPTLSLLFVSCTLILRAECPADRAELRHLAGQQRWEQAAECLAAISARTVDEQYGYARALAALGRRQQAETAFREGQNLAPEDPRFPSGLAGLAFLDEHYAEAKAHVKRALRLAPGDPYLTDFLATIYLLEENLDAALLYWNRIEKPRIERVDMDTSPRTDAVLLDRAFAIAPASTLRLDELAATRSRLRHLGIYSQQRFDLLARDGQDFDLRFQALDKPRWGGSSGSKIGAALSLLSGVPYQTLHAEFFNLNGRGLNVQSLARWDPKMRRLNVAVSKPVGRDPTRRLAFLLDARDEPWRIDTASGVSDRFELQKAEAGVEFSAVPTGRLTWRTGVTIATRQFRSQIVGPAGPPESGLDLSAEGPSINALFGVDFQILRLPERRLTLDAAAGWRLGRMLRDARKPYSRWTQSLTLRWFPKATGEDYAVLTRFRSGQTFGRAPFDEFFALGMERDNDLWLRGHPGTAEGYKGAALLGGQYELMNLELDKILYRHAFWKLTAGPFLDAGSIRDPRGVLGSRTWQWDSGIQVKAGLTGGLSLVFSYGRNLQSGGDAFYWRVEH